MMVTILSCFGVNAFGQEESLPAPGDLAKSDLSIKTLTLTADNVLVGEVATAISSFDATTPAEGLSVTISRNGVVIKEATTDKDGKFALKDVESGRYNLVAVGVDTLFASGVEVVDFAPNSPANSRLVAMPAPLQVITAVLSKHVYKSIDTTEVNFGQLASMSTMSPSLVEGKIAGTITDLAGNLPESTNVMLMQGDQIVDQTIAANGKYQFNSVKAGIYSIVAASKNGFSVIGLEVVKAPVVKNVSAQGPGEANLTLADGTTIRLVQVQDEDRDEELGFLPFDDGGVITGGGGAPIGGGGIGGGGVGGGGLAGLAGLAGIAGVAGSGNNLNPNVASPFQ